ncbi:MAG: DUF732 domain-containing protein [Mycobacterium pseudokansasii]|uniref:DUF732 domain-containing protein n=1 Tax=Mycobacterium pseudokansasii TaxID=2341080 RepID=A0A498QQN1_9MYCO|nr:DUF732 domain-containing protein [Mycobacterium pseudokansasii]KZS70130.1 hypothetical protein A4G27_21390 [Mycobacterium kansasii]MBY0387664.1 DUF732 domain-containing protein [Mycobacterium pseudokansasii]VAZ92641.1 hypothetical protein LAUMK21_01702 [Mycobacterium pseudokansasii]VBA48833.1 hypothetical protein LAUMK142_01572 [Mycobacterium pseudokansasii]
MAEPVPASEDTAALGGETAALPNSAPTDAVHTAWSHTDEADEPTEPDEGKDLRDDEQPVAIEAAGQTWGTTWGRASALLLLGIGIAVLIVIGGWALTTEKSPRQGAQPPAAPAATTAAPTATTAPAPTTIASTPEQDSGYIQALNDRGITFANPDAAVYNGKLVCLNFRRGMTVDQIVAAFRASNPALSSNAEDYVAISMRTYCP